VSVGCRRVGLWARGSVSLQPPASADSQHSFLHTELHTIMHPLTRPLTPPMHLRSSMHSLPHTQIDAATSDGVVATPPPAMDRLHAPAQVGGRPSGVRGLQGLAIRTTWPLESWLNSVATWKKKRPLHTWMTWARCMHPNAAPRDIAPCVRSRAHSHKGDMGEVHASQCQ
jgi:hypothetical protein